MINLQYNHLAALGRELNSYAFPIKQDFLEYFHDPSKSDSKKSQVSYKPLAVGRRKTSVAKVRVKNGDGEVVINSKSLLEYFPRLEDRQQVLFPLNVVGSLGKVDVSARVSGGGITGTRIFCYACDSTVCVHPNRSSGCYQSWLEQSLGTFIWCIC